MKKFEKILYDRLNWFEYINKIFIFILIFLYKYILLVIYIIQKKYYKNVKTLF